MSRKISRLLFCVLVITIYSSCKSKRPAVTKAPLAAAPALAVQRNELVQALREKQTTFDYFSARVKTNYEEQNGKDLAFTMHLRMQKGKYIWISATAVLGIEAARIYITQDSIKIMDKLNRKYLARDYAYFNKFSDVPLTLESLQNLFIGNQILELNDTIPTDSVATGYVLQQAVLKTLYQVYVNKANRDIFLQEFIQQDSVQATRLSVQYSEFRQQNNVRYANKIGIRTEAKATMRATFEYQNVSLSPIEEIIFRIPAGYSPME